MAAAGTPRGKAERAPDPRALSDPHNSFFVYTFGQKVHAIGLLRAILPPALGQRLRWDSLTREPVSFVDARLRWLHGDLLFSVRTLDTEEEVLIYLLVEHQSTPHPLMAYRVLRYVTRVWDDHLRKHRTSARLPLVVPAVLYNGREPWSAARTLRDLLDAPAPLVQSVTRHVPQSGYLLIDLRFGRADQLVADAITAYGRVARWALAIAGDDARVLEGVRRLDGLLQEIMKQPDGRAAFVALMRYILATHEHIDRDELHDVLTDAIDAAAGKDVMTIYDQLIEEGRQKGLHQGIAEGRAEMLLDLLAAKFGTVPAGVRKRVQHASADELAAWGTRVLTAATLEDVLGPVPPRQAVRRAPKPRR